MFNFTKTKKKHNKMMKNTVKKIVYLKKSFNFTKAKRNTTIRQKQRLGNFFYIFEKSNFGSF